MNIKAENNGLNGNSRFSANKLNEQLDLENALTLISSPEVSTKALLDKVKIIFNISLNRKIFEFILKKTLEEDDMRGSKVRIGSFLFNDFLITGIITKNENSLKHAIHIKHFTLGYEKYAVSDKIRNISIIRSGVRDEKWVNRSEIRIFGGSGREYIVKFNFITEN